MNQDNKGGHSSDSALYSAFSLEDQSLLYWDDYSGPSNQPLTYASTRTDTQDSYVPLNSLVDLSPPSFQVPPDPVSFSSPILQTNTTSTSTFTYSPPLKELDRSPEWRSNSGYSGRPPQMQPQYVVQDDVDHNYRLELRDLIEKLNSQSQKLRQTRSEDHFIQPHRKKAKTQAEEGPALEQRQSLQRRALALASELEVPRAADQHLSYIIPHLELVAAYREYMWLYFPVHPAALDESNLRFFLSTREGLEDVSALSLSISLEICFGASLTGNLQLRTEFERRAEQQLACLRNYPSIMTDYSMAMALCAMGCYVLYWKMNSSLSREYFEQAMNICKKLNAYNSDVFSRCLYALSAHAGASHENIRQIKEHVHLARQLPYFPMTSTDTPRFVTAGPTNVSSNIAQLTPISHRNLTIACEIARIVSNVVGAMRLYKENVRLHVYNPYASSTRSGIFAELFEAIESWDREVHETFRYLDGAGDPLPKSAVYFTSALVIVMYMEAYRLIGQVDIALKYALEFLHITRNYPGSSYLYIASGCPYFVELVLEFFFEMGRLDCVKQQLDTIKSWTTINPLIENIYLSFVERLQTAHHTNPPPPTNTSSPTIPVYQHDAIRIADVATPPSDSPPLRDASHADAQQSAATTVPPHSWGESEAYGFAMPPSPSTSYTNPQHSSFAPIQYQQPPQFSQQQQQQQHQQQQQQPQQHSPQHFHSAQPPQQQPVYELYDESFPGIEAVPYPEQSQPSYPVRPDMHLQFAQHPPQYPYAQQTPVDIQQRFTLPQQQPQPQQPQLQQPQPQQQLHSQSPPQYPPPLPQYKPQRQPQPQQQQPQLQQQPKPQQQQQPQLQQQPQPQQGQRQRRTGQKPVKKKFTFHSMSTPDGPVTTTTSTPSRPSKRKIVEIGGGTSSGPAFYVNWKKGVGLWDKDAHLVLVADCLRFLSDFRKYLWHFSPLHPAVLDDSNVHYYLTTPEGTAETSSIALSFSMCMCRGAMISGNTKISIEFFHQAEKQLEALLKAPESTTDYAIAMAAMVMVWQASYLDIRKDKVNGFLATASSICKNIQAFNSEVFIKYLYSLATIPHSFKEREQLLGTLKQANAHEYFPVYKVRPESMTFLPSGGDVQAQRNRIAALQHRMPVSTKNLTAYHEVSKIFVSLQSSLNLHSNDICSQSISEALSYLSDYDSLMMQIHREQEINSDPWPSTVNKFHRLLVLSAKVQCYGQIGDRDKALAPALEFLRISGKKKFSALYIHITSMMSKVLTVFLRWGTDEMVEQQLSALHQWAAVHPEVEKLRVEYQAKLNARREELLRQHRQQAQQMSGEKEEEKTKTEQL